MEQRLEGLAEQVKEQFGLRDYTLAREHIHRRVGPNRETQFIYSMEWFPSDSDQDDEDLNPEGTASIEVDVHTGQLQHVIFVGGVTHAESIVLDDEAKVRRWIETETGVNVAEQTEQASGEIRTYQYHSVIDGIRTTPAGTIEIRLDEAGRLVFFTIHGRFPQKEEADVESFALTTEKVKEIVMEQLQLLEFPVMEKECFVSAFALEEIYVTNDGRETLPFQLFWSEQRVERDEILTYSSPLRGTVETQEIDLSEEVSLEQLEKQEPHPDLEPLEPGTVDRVNKAIVRFLRMNHPEDSGKWRWKNVCRDHGYVVAELEEVEKTRTVFQRKLKLFLSKDGGEVLTHIDTGAFLEMFEAFEAADTAQYTKTEAYELLKDKLKLRPTYVLDRTTGRYCLCGLLDCDDAVLSHSGEIVPLADL
ncbi:UNVERIFIED_CONTAM: hypothetical protein N8J90_00180 [Halobacillus marinus]